MSKPVKLTDLLNEGNVWDRNDDGSLPTLADTMRKHAEKKGKVNEGTERGSVKSTVKSGSDSNMSGTSREVRFKTGAYNQGNNPLAMLMAFDNGKSMMMLTKQDAQKVVAILIEFIKDKSKFRPTEI